MIIREVKGDAVKLFNNRHVHLIHGCNCFCNMGAGIARDVRDYIPGAFKVDAMTMKGSAAKLGKCSQYINSLGQRVFNAYTQFDHWSPGPRVDYAALANAFRFAVDALKDEPVRLPILTPLIGAGLAGGDWTRISAIINEVTGDYPIIVVHYDPTIHPQKVDLS